MAQRKQVQSLNEAHASRLREDALTKLRTRLRNFAAARDWNQFHSSKNLAIALSVEASELLEHFQWLTDKQSRQLSPVQTKRIEEEVADVFLYLIRLADVLDIDLILVAERKIDTNSRRYPVDKSKGNAKKYTEL